MKLLRTVSIAPWLRRLKIHITFEATLYLTVGVSPWNQHFPRIRALLCYRELRVSHYPPLTIHLLEDVQAAVRFSNLFAILRALDGSTVRHHYNVWG